MKNIYTFKSIGATWCFFNALDISIDKDIRDW